MRTKAFSGALAVLLCAFISVPGQASNNHEVVTSQDPRASAPALTKKGPLGPYGPLGAVGPLGRQAWNVNTWFSMIGNWRFLSQFLTGIGGPLSALGPLGEGGPVGRALKDFPEVFKPGGPYAILGPLGPLGALGPLGPLGPVGAHGFGVDSDGRYTDARGRVVHEITVPYDGRAERTFSLFEMLEQESARGQVNDTTFMVLGRASDDGRADSYRIKTKEAEYLSLVVIPEHESDSFAVRITDAKGKSVAEAKSREQVNFLTLRMPAGAAAVVQVKRMGASGFGRPNYRLVVVGAPQGLLPGE